jgi:hypothetical protein
MSTSKRFCARTAIFTPSIPQQISEGSRFLDSEFFEAAPVTSLLRWIEIHGFPLCKSTAVALPRKSGPCPRLIFKRTSAFYPTQGSGSPSPLGEPSPSAPAHHRSATPSSAGRPRTFVLAPAQRRPDILPSRPIPTRRSRSPPIPLTHPAMVIPRRQGVPPAIPLRRVIHGRAISSPASFTRPEALRDAPDHRGSKSWWQKMTDVNL